MQKFGGFAFYNLGKLRPNLMFGIFYVDPVLHSGVKLKLYKCIYFEKMCWDTKFQPFWIEDDRDIERST